MYASRRRRKDAAKDREKKARDADPTRVPNPFYLGDDVELAGSGLSPTGEWMLVLLVPKKKDDGKTNQQITDLGGMNDFVLSPDGEGLLLTHSTTTMPPELYIQVARPDAPARRVTGTVSEAFLAVPWVGPEIVAILSTHHDRPIYSRVYAPGAPSSAKRPAVVFVHGAGYLQNSHQGWSGYFREFMFHTLLIQHGFVVLDMDYRASAGYGRDWRTTIYRDMGTPELEDLEDGVQWLAEHKNVDPKRVGVYGGSYGGFITFMSLFKKPELFACGAALRPVTDWAHYNHGYTSRILNPPSVDPEAYERSSPIEFAEGLSKAAPDRSRHAGRQRLLQGFRPTGSAAHRARERRLGDGHLSGRATRIPRAFQLARRVPSYLQAVRDPPSVPSRK